MIFEYVALATLLTATLAIVGVTVWGARRVFPTVTHSVNYRDYEPTVKAEPALTPDADAAALFRHLNRRMDGLELRTSQNHKGTIYRSTATAAVRARSTNGRTPWASRTSQAVED